MDPLAAYERAGGTWAVHTKRGCPLECPLLQLSGDGRSPTALREAADIVDEIEHVRRTVGPRTFEFTDSTFNVPESHAAGICEEVLRRKLRVNLRRRPQPADGFEKPVHVMRRAGFVR